MSDNSFDLIGIFHQIFKKKVFVIVITLAALIISLIFCSMQTPGYKSETIFIVKNPLMVDRNFVFRHTDFENREFFASPDDVDNVKSISKSDGLLWYIMDKFKLKEAYHIDNDAKLLKKVRGNFKTVMEDTRDLRLSYIDPDPARAAQITAAAREYVEAKFMEYFLATNKDITGALGDKINVLKDSIRIADDSIQNLRAAIGNYSQLLPSRGTAIVTTNASATAQNAPLIEKMHEIAVSKDKMTADVADYQTLINEYDVMANHKIHVFYVIQDAYTPGEPYTPMTLIIVAASTLAALFFACVLVLFGGFYSFVMNKRGRN